MFGSKRPHVLVVGAGPVGMFAALVLARNGVRVAIVDEAPRRGKQSYALALHEASVRELDAQGLWAELARRSLRLDRLAFYTDRTRRATLGLDDEPLAVVGQDVLEATLEQALLDLGVEVLWDHSVRSVSQRLDAVEVSLCHLARTLSDHDPEESSRVVSVSRLEPAFVIGADGHRSRVREELQIAFPAHARTEHSVVFEFETDADLDEARVVLRERTTDVLWPLPDRRCRWTFQVGDIPLPAEPRPKSRMGFGLDALLLPTLNSDLLARLVDERAPWFDGSIEQIHWCMKVSFEHRMAGRFGERRAWLAGDAGHLTGPVGAQSMNVGLREARDLAERMTRVLSGSALQLLTVYGDERFQEWRGLLGLTGGLTPRPGADLWTVPYTDRLLSCLPASGAALSDLAKRLGLTWASPSSSAAGS